MQRRHSARLQEQAVFQAQLGVGMVGDAGGPTGLAPQLPGLGSSLLNMPLQEQLRLLHAGGLGQLPAVAPLVLNGAGPAPPAPAGGGGAAAARRKPQRGSVARPSEREATKGTTSSSNRPLSSKFRGVCWNRKNKRWQAAINSGGKYLYLGSYIEEDEAAMAFDRAAIKLRGRKGKLNFTYEDYVDGAGNLKEDIHLPSGAKEAADTKAAARESAKTASAAGGRSGKRARKGAAAAAAGGGGAAGAGGGAGGAPPAGAVMGAGLANLSMADVKRLLAGGGGALPPPLMGAGAPDRGVTTGFVGSFPAGPPGPGASAFAAAAGGLELPAFAPGLALAGSAPGGGAGGGAAQWGAVLQEFRPRIEAELGAGRAIAQLVEPPAAGGPGAPGGGGGGAPGAGGTLVKGVVYTQPAPGGGRRAGSGGVAYGAALWDGARLVDHGTKPDLETALETATSLAAGEEDLQGDAALRDLLGGNSALVPRAASLALFQALGSLRPGELPGLDALGGDDDADGMGPPGAKRTRSQTRGQAAAAAAVAAAHGAKRPRNGSGGLEGGAPGAAFASTSALAGTGLADMLKSLAGMRGGA
ncbi:MAG: hypothetical protein J3K34DRAFT_525267 [Monoraphidium minutum]|nr:MAG: hypothetical protein J3K34DRAFT_525267 [Monoraphidium minutum]